MSRYIVLYDISHSGHRNALARKLERWGARVQHSVFDVDLPRSVLLEILDQVTPLLRPEDAVLAVPSCRSCQSAELGTPIENSCSEPIVVAQILPSMHPVRGR